MLMTFDHKTCCFIFRRELYEMYENRFKLAEGSLFARIELLLGVKIFALYFICGSQFLF